MDIELTDAEKSAIRSLKRLARNWPQSLVLFASGTLSVRKVDADGAAFAERIVANMSRQAPRTEPENQSSPMTFGGRRPSSCSRPLSDSHVEEIIACLWSIMWVILWVHHAPQWMLWVVGVKAASDHLCAVVCAVREIRGENDSILPPAEGGSTKVNDNEKPKI